MTYRLIDEEGQVPQTCSLCYDEIPVGEEVEDEEYGVICKECRDEMRDEEDEEDEEDEDPDFEDDDELE